MSVTRTATTRELASFLARLSYKDIPHGAVERTKELFLDWFGSAGTQAAGLWEFLRDAADSKQLHASRAASDGLLAAYLARDGFTGAERNLEGERGMAAGMSSDADLAGLVDKLGERWAVLETSFKYHAACRHTHPAADALLKGMEERGLTADDIASVRARVHARVHAAAMDVRGPVSDPRTIHQSKFSMGFVLALIANRGSAGIEDFTEEALDDARLRAFSGKVEMVFDEEVDAAYSRRWIGVVDIETPGGERFTSRVEVPKGDPGNSLSREELEEKARKLSAHGGGASDREMDRVVARIWSLDEQADVLGFLPRRSA